MLELQVGEREVRAAVDELARQGGGGDDGGGRTGIDVVLHDGVVEDDGAHQGEPLAEVGLRGWPAPRAGLGVGIRAPLGGLPDTEPKGLGCGDGHDDLVRLVWVGHAPLHHARPVLVEELTVVAAVDAEIGLEGSRRGLPVGLNGDGVERGIALGVRDVGQMRDLLHQGSVVAGRESKRRGVERRAEAQVRRVGAGAIAPMATPPTSPIRSTSDRYAPQRRRNVARKR